METVKNGFLKLMDVVTKLELALSELALAVLIVMTVVGTLVRYFLRSPFTWMEEFQLACVIWIVFLAASAAFASKSHVAIEMVIDLLPKPVQKVIDVMIGIVVIGVLIYVIQASMNYMEVFARSGRATPILKIPYTLIYGIAPVSCVLMILEYFHGILRPHEEEEDV